MAVAASAPKSDVTAILLTSTRLASYVQVNSALVYPSAGTLFKLTVTTALSPALMLDGLTDVVDDGEGGGVMMLSRMVRT